MTERSSIRWTHVYIHLAMPRPARDRIFREFEGNIQILPRVTIDRIVRYYFLLDSIDALVEDMRSETFKSLDVERRKAIFFDYSEMQKTARFFGVLANSLIDAFENQGRGSRARIGKTFACRRCRAS